MEHYKIQKALLALLAGLTWCLSAVSTDIIGPTDFCLLDSFEPSCNQGEVVFIESALYGRMESGKCIPEAEGNFGCFADVKTIIDFRCSGRQTCSVSPINRDLVATEPCPGTGTFGYITISYKCLKAANNQMQCGPSNQIKVTQNEGFIVAPSGASQNCPLLIQVPSGRLINFSVYNFMKSKTHSACYEVAVIKEKDQKKSVHVCPSDDRLKEDYTSSGHDVTVEVTDLQRQGNEQGSYMLEFKVAGCPLPNIPENAHVERDGDTAKVKCNDSDNSWFIYCKNNKWTKHNRKCPKGISDWGIFKTEASDFPYGIFLTSFIGVGIGIFLGGFLLFLAINTFQRHQRRLRSAYEAPPIIPDPDYKMYDTAKMDLTLIPGFATGMRAHTLGRHQMSAPPVPSQPPEDERRFSRHTYEKPKYNSTDNQPFVEA